MNSAKTQMAVIPRNSAAATSVRTTIFIAKGLRSFRPSNVSPCVVSLTDNFCSCTNVAELISPRYLKAQRIWFWLLEARETICGAIAACEESQRSRKPTVMPITHSCDAHCSVAPTHTDPLYRNMKEEFLTSISKCDGGHTLG